eukprot:260355-Amphidinium_carterae.1
MSEGGCSMRRHFCASWTNFSVGCTSGSSRIVEFSLASMATYIVVIAHPVTAHTNFERLL